LMILLGVLRGSFRTSGKSFKDIILEIQGSTGMYASQVQTSGEVLILAGPSQGLVQGALEYVQQREQAYRDENVHPTWKMRGHGHLYTYQRVVLAGHASVVRAVGMVRIFNVHPETSSTFQDCRLLTLWVRVNGPEIMAGKAKAVTVNSTNTNVNFKCYWKFDFDLLVPGNYTLDAKIIQWNGNVHVKNHQAQDVQVDQGISQCSQVYPGNILSPEANQEAPQNTSMMSFKPYSPLQGCCEICRRTPHCKYFATPPRLMPSPTWVYNGCDLFFGPDVDPEQDIPRPRVIQTVIDRMNGSIEWEKRLAAARAANPDGRRHHHRHRRLLATDGAWGSPHSDSAQVQHFLGCGWSFFHAIEFPCISGDLDDQIFLEENVLEVPAEADWTVSPNQQPAQLPLCEIQDEYVLSNTNAFSRANQRYRNGTAERANTGRWVREPYPSSEHCPHPYELFSSVSHSDKNPISVPDPDRPHCWFRDDLTPLNKQCKEPNCGNILPAQKWNATKLQHEREWMAVWRNYHCDYMEFTNNQLSQCFQTQKIKAVETAGASLAEMMVRYVSSRLENVTFYDANAADARRAVVNTLEWPHRLWHEATDSFAGDLDQKFPSVLDTNDIIFWASPFFVSSEREPHVHLERAIQFMDVAERVLTPKGYQMLNGFDITAAMTVSSVIESSRSAIHSPL
jgi:hypothetical protein